MHSMKIYNNLHYAWGKKSRNKFTLAAEEYAKEREMQRLGEARRNCNTAGIYRCEIKGK